MFARHETRALARAALLALAALAPAAHAAAQTPAAQPEPQRKQQGPAAGPAIKLPRGAGADEARTQNANARDDEGARPAWSPQRWEYCYVRGFKYRPKGFSSSSGHTVYALVHYLPSGSEEVEGDGEEQALGNAFAKLGEGGWELAGVRTDLSLSDGNGTTSATYFFKRPKGQE